MHPVLLIDNFVYFVEYFNMTAIAMFAAVTVV